MELREAVKIVLTNVLNQLSYHPLFSPYLGTDNPPQHYLHQYEVVVRMAFRKPVRVLIGDEIGLGKTVTSLAIVKYLERVGAVRKTLIVVPRVLVFQWHKELMRMGVPSSKIIHLERENIEFYRTYGFPEGYYIASMDLLKREEKISKIEDEEWDLIIVDECHKFGYRTKRFKRIGKKLIKDKPSRNVVFLSATPHRGDPRDYIHRLQLLDPYLVNDWKKLDEKRFYKLTHGAILFRRTKEDVNKVYEEKKIFTDAKFYAGLIAEGEDEKRFVKELVTFLRMKLNELAYEKHTINKKVIPLLTTLVFKRATSSPYSALTTLQRLLLKRVEQDFPNELIASVKSFLSVGYEDFEYEKDPEDIFNEFLERASSLLSLDDKKKIKELKAMAQSIMEKGDTKLNATISLLENIIANTDFKVIIFTEYKDTLDYIFENLIKRHPEWKKSILCLSGKETRDERDFNNVRNTFERDPKVRILVATDVVAEGLNLQVANIVINYEVPWSLVKLEQRIGRVWRIGQERDVEVYTLFMDNVADRAALNSIYQKLLNLKGAELQARPVIGQEVLYYAEAEDIMRFPASVALTKEERKKKFIKVTESKFIKTYLEKDEGGLQELVNSIIAAKQEIEKEISSKEVLYKPRTKKDVEKVIRLTGFKNHEEVFNALKKLLKASASVLDLTILDEGDKIKIRKGLEMPYSISTLDDFYAILTEKNDVSMNKTVCLVAQGNDEALIGLIPVLVKDQRDNGLLYVDLVGVDLTTEKIFRGSSLIEILSQAIANGVGVEELDSKAKEIPPIVYAKIKNEMRRSISEILNSIKTYREKLEYYRLRNHEENWIKISDIDIVFSNAVGYLHFVRFSPTPEDISEDVKKEVERIAVEKVLAIEKAEGRIPSLVPETEHYDIKSVDPSTGEVRLIEVKGHKGLSVYAELTEEEAKLAVKEKERYWLYIVYDIGSGQPKVLRFQNPLETMDIQVFERIQRRYLLKPKRVG